MRWTAWEVLIGSGDYEIHRRQDASLRLLWNCQRRSQYMLVVSGRRCVLAEGTAESALFHLLLGVMNREGVEEAVMRGPGVPDEAVE